MGHADVQDAFYNFALPEPLRPLFSLRQVRAGAIGFTEVDGCAVRPNAMVTLVMAVIPMGWNWALWWVQTLHEKLVIRAGCCPSEQLSDRCILPDIKTPAHTVYVDNFIAFGSSAHE